MTHSNGNSSDDARAPAGEDFFAPPPFNAEQALLNLKRNLRELRPLAERGNAFTFQGQVVIDLAIEAGQLSIKLAKRPARSPEWEHKVCKNGAEVRHLQDEVKRRLARWVDAE